MFDDKNLNKNKNIGAALVVGSGIGGMQAALDLAESGIKVYLVDKKPSIGGAMSQLDKTFPTNDCAMCTMAPRLVEISRHKDIEKIMLSEVERISGEPGNFSVFLKKKPRYVDETKCTGCGACVSNCPTRNILQIEEKEQIDLEPQFKKKVIEILEKHKNTEGPLMPILQDINTAFNYFPESVLRYVSRETGYPLSHIFKIATFYGSFSITPRGKHVINICMGTTCYVKGSDRIMEAFSEALEIKPGETTPDMKFTLNSLRCIGCCGLAPAVMIGETVYGKLQIPQIPDIVSRYREI
jgi:NADH:ubiquinone oxidoreductase subunit E